MARLHIREQAGNNLYNVIVHSPTPAGNNSAGTAWSSVIQAALSPVTQMTIGNGFGQITNTEANAVAAGTVIETQFLWGDQPEWDNATRVADLNIRATQAVDDAVARIQERLKHFGRTVA